MRTASGNPPNSDGWTVHQVLASAKCKTDNDAKRVSCVKFHMIRRKTRPPRSIKEITSAMGPLTADEARRATEYIRLARRLQYLQLEEPSCPHATAFG